ncbi:MAG: hypothetical protein ABWX65_01605 [Mycetocola sp.]
MNRKILGALAIVVAVLLQLASQAWSLITSTGGALDGLRKAYYHDQLGYMSIVVNVAQGRFDEVEPDTETGLNFYPRLYYSAVGLVARIFGLHPVVAWNVTGLALQALLVALLAFTLIVVTRRWWAGLVAPLPFVLGTFSYLHGDGWASSLQSHAVIWGPYGVLFSLNGETAGLCIGMTAALGLFLVWTRAVPPAVRITVSLVASAAIGMLANVQTYSFLTTVYTVSYILAALALYRGRHTVLAIVSGLLVPLVFLFGPLVNASAGQLATLVFGLLPAIPGLLVLVVATRGMLALYGVVAVAAAAPQLVWTVSGIINRDPFLVYRVASNSDLGVASPGAVLGAVCVALPILFVLIVGLWRKSLILVALSSGFAVSTVVLVTNDIWGANAEPYRFWIDTFFVGAIVSTVALALIAAERWPAPVASVPETATTVDGDADGAIDAPPRLPDRLRRFITVGIVVCLAVWVVSLPDWVRYRADASMNALWDPSTPREEAIRDLALSTLSADRDELVMADPCVDPRTMKVNSGVPVAYFHLGMAWPAEVDAMGAIVGSRLEGEMNLDAAEVANARWVLTDSACPEDWGTLYADDLVETARIPYTTAPGEALDSRTADAGDIVLWRVGGE